MVVTADLAGEYLRINRALTEALGIAASDVATLVAEPLGSGEHNANFVFARPADGRRFVLRVNYSSQMGLQDQIGYEYEALRLLEPSGCTPKALYVDRSKDFYGHGVLVIEHCPGRHLDFTAPGHVEQAARMMADVHSVRAGDDCPLVRPADPLRAQFEECVGHAACYRASNLQSSMVNRYLDRMLARACDMLDIPLDAADSCHILNTEAVPSHFLIPDDGSRGHFLDWEKPILGEVAQDVAYFLSPTTTIWDTDFIFDMDQRAAFLDTYWEAVDGRFGKGGFERRFEAYVVMNCLRGITWSARAWVEYHDPARPLKNAKTFELLKTYLSEEYLEMVCQRHFG